MNFIRRCRTGVPTSMAARSITGSGSQLEVAKTVRAILPDTHPLFVRISSTDWKEGGWTLDDSVKLSEHLRGVGVDLVDASSGGVVPDAKIIARAGFSGPVRGTDPAGSRYFDRSGWAHH